MGATFLQVLTFQRNGGLFFLANQAVIYRGPWKSVEDDGSPERSDAATKRPDADARASKLGGADGGADGD